MKRIILLVSIFCMLFTTNIFALEWKALHDKSSDLKLSEALAAVSANPNSLSDLYVLGLVYFNLHQDKKAEEVFNKIIAIDPSIIEAKWGVAEALRRQHNLKEAEAILNNVIRDSPEFSPAYISLAYVKYLQMDFEQAVRLALKVIEQGRENVDLDNYTLSYTLYAGSKGMIAHYGGPFSKLVNGTAVLPNLRKAEKLKANLPGVLFGLGSFYLIAPPFVGGDVDSAEKYLRKAIEVDPLFADAYVRLAQYYSIKGDKAKFEEYLSKALRIDPKNELALDFKSGECKFVCVAGKD